MQKCALGFFGLIFLLLLFFQCQRQAMAQSTLEIKSQLYHLQMTFLRTEFIS